MEKDIKSKKPKGIRPQQAGQLTNWQKNTIRTRLQEKGRRNGMLERKIEDQEFRAKPFPFSTPIMDVRACDFEDFQRIGQGIGTL